MDQRTHDMAQQGLLVCLLGCDHQERLQAFLDGLRDDQFLSEQQIASIEQRISEVLEERGGASEEDAAGKLLSEREQTVLRLVAHGYSGPNIGSRLHISPKTVETHKARAFKKLGFTGRPDIIRYAIEHGWFHDPIDDVPA